MNKKDFYNLKIGIDIYYKGIKRELVGIREFINGNVIFISRLGNSKEVDELRFNEAMNDLSFTHPEKKKRFWQWKMKSNYESWSRCYYYLDEEGYDTSGDLYSEDWEDAEKHKIKDDYIDVEVSE